MMPYDVAVIIPTYNRAAYIGTALDSVLAQTILNDGARVEVAIVDDGSTDATDQAVAPYLQRYAAGGGPVRMSYTRLEKQGVVAARNTALAQTSAPLVAFLDSDDYWAPAKLERQIAGLGRDPDAGVSHTSFVYVNQAGFLTRDAGDKGERPDNPVVGRCARVLLREDLVIFSSVLMKREIIDQAARAEAHGQPFDPRWTNAQDYDLLLRAARLCGYTYIAQPLTFYRLHDSHGAMGNLQRAFGFHARVQLDFARRWGQELNIDAAEARRCVTEFLHSRAEALFWQRKLDVAGQLCALAEELGVADARFAKLARKAARPVWLYRVKDAVDGWFRRR